MTGYTQWSSRAVYAGPPEGWYSKDSRSLFMRFDNIDEGPDPGQLNITWLPEDNTGLEVPYSCLANILPRSGWTGSRIPFIIGHLVIIVLGIVLG
jgi:hypothetical protein